MELKEFIARFESGRRDFTWVDLQGANLSNLDLTGVHLFHANLSGANLTGTTLKQADLRRANLSGTILQQTNFEEANLGHANLTGATLNGTRFMGATLPNGMVWQTQEIPGNLSAKSVVQQQLVASQWSQPRLNRHLLNQRQAIAKPYGPPLDSQPGFPETGPIEPNRTESLSAHLLASGMLASKPARRSMGGGGTPPGAAIASPLKPQSSSRTKSSSRTAVAPPRAVRSRARRMWTKRSLPWVTPLALWAGYGLLGGVMSVHHTPMADWVGIWLVSVLWGLTYELPVLIPVLGAIAIVGVTGLPLWPIFSALGIAIALFGVLAIGFEQRPRPALQESLWVGSLVLMIGSLLDWVLNLSTEFSWPDHWQQAVVLGLGLLCMAMGSTLWSQQQRSRLQLLLWFAISSFLGLLCGTLGHLLV